MTFTVNLGVTNSNQSRCISHGNKIFMVISNHTGDMKNFVLLISKPQRSTSREEIHVARFDDTANDFNLIEHD